jgi:hypothetical protein
MAGATSKCSALLTTVLSGSRTLRTLPASPWPVTQANDERLGRVDHVALDAGRHAAQRGLSQRALTLEDAGAGNRPVDALGRGAVRLAPRAVRGLRPHDGLPVTPRDKEQALAAGRCAVVARAQLAPLDGVAQAVQGVDEGAELAAAVARAGPAVLGERPPGDELFDVLQADDARLHGGCPAHRHPGQAADLLLHRLAALGLAEVLAVRAEPRQPHGPAGAHFAGVHVPHRLAQVQRLRVVRLVHGHGLGVVVDGDVDGPADGPLDAGAGTSAAGEVVDHQLVGQGQQELRGQHAGPPGCAQCVTVASITPPLVASRHASPSHQPGHQSAVPSS